MRLLDIGSGRPTFTDEQGRKFETLDNVLEIGCDHYIDIEYVDGLKSALMMNVYDEIRAHHILEHLNPAKKVWVMATLFLWLKEGGILDIEVPLAGTDQFWQDPTHQSGWVAMTFRYFEKGNGFGEAFAKRCPGSPLFEIAEQPKVKDNGWRLGVKLRKPKAK